MNTLILPIVLTAVLVLVGCTGANDTTPIPSENQTPPGEEPLQVEYANGALSYTARVMAPTPCHELRIEEHILESHPVQVRIEVTFIDPDEEACPQVVTEREVSGTITLAESPGTVTLITPLETHERELGADVDSGQNGGNDQPSESAALRADYLDGTLTYTARVMAPTPCHELRIEEHILESDPPRVEVSVTFIDPSPDLICTQVLDEREINGSIEIGQEPSSVRVDTPLESHEVDLS